ncbi:MAG: hypothetical protein NTX45_15225 [Proteobacteria bacterium]|nr:hypothetical protein [Pseudomonadota bacterium]
MDHHLRHRAWSQRISPALGLGRWIWLRQHDTVSAGPGALSFFYTNDQSARLMFYHDHAMGITRLNVYDGMAAGYVLQDPTEQALVADDTGCIIPRGSFLGYQWY